MADQAAKYVFLLFSVYLWVQTCHSSTPTGNSLKPDDILNHTTQLCSTTNIFCMSFLMIGDNPDFTYLQIRNGSAQYQTAIIWIGNRNEPVVNNSGELILDHSGELKIVSQGKPIKVLYSPIQPINNAKAILLDNGNFELQQLHPNGSKTILWQSFDYPLDTLLPGMKLGINHRTGRNWSLVTWITNLSPASGDFTLEWEPKNWELVIRVRGLVCWKSGSYRNSKPFQNMLEEIHSIYHFHIVSNEEEDYLTFTARNKSNDRFPYWTLYANGSIHDWLSGDKIARADRCYGFNEDGGCQKFSFCSNQVGKTFDPVLGYINVTDNRNPKYVENDTSSRITKVDCWQRCWSNCNCVGFGTIYYNLTRCTLIYNGEIVTTTFLADDDEDRHPIYMLRGPHNDEDGDPICMLRGPSHHKGNWIWRGVVIAISVPLICLFILCLALRKRKIILEGRRGKSTKADFFDFTDINDLQDEINKGHDLRIFSYEVIMEATDEFSLENKLGEGGFGPVYKGLLSTGKKVAVKRLSKTSGQGVVEFKNELKLISELQHTNLVQLLGCCIHNEEMMLVYEYMSNKSLDFFLFDSSQGKLLDWEKRFKIIEGIAQGLLYLHKYSRLKVIHRDLKASNILLDEYMNPKISDFGMARMFTQQESKVNTNRIVGTYGYMSPEYAMEGIFSTKSDVYSFGVLLLEIVSGRRNSSFLNDNGDGPLSLVGHAWDLWKKDATLQLMDPALNDSCVKEEILRCIHIGILCIEEDADDRPTMLDIVSMLINKSATLSLPKRPAILYVRKNKFGGGKNSHVSSIYEVSLTELDAR